MLTLTFQDMTMDDMVFDEALLRRMKRHQQAEREQAQAARDDDDDDEVSQEDDTVEAPVKPEPSNDDTDGVDEDEA